MTSSQAGGPTGAAGAECRQWGPAPARSPRLALGSVWVRALHSIPRHHGHMSPPQLLREQTITVGQPRGASAKEITANAPGGVKVWEQASSRRGAGRHRAAPDKQSEEEADGRMAMPPLEMGFIPLQQTRLLCPRPQDGLEAGEDTSESSCST